MLVQAKRIEYHRNGVGGSPFHVIRFTTISELTNIETEMIAIVFEDIGHVAVFDFNKLKEGRIDFGDNSWRGDVFEPMLRKAIADKDVKERV